MRLSRPLAILVLALMVMAAGASGAPSPTHVRFTAAGDYGMVPSTTGAVLQAVAASDPDLHLTLGDLSYSTTGNEQAWCDFVTSRVGAGFPFELLSGNHESNGVNGNINDFSACLPNQLPGVVGTYGRQYYVDVPQDDPLVRFVMISPNLTYPDGTWNYSAGSTRYAWTAAAIDGARAAGTPWVVVGMHKVCLSAGSYPCEVGADLANLLLAKRVDLVLSGHEHLYERSKQLALGAGCPTLTIGAYNAACVRDSDDSLVAGAGTVFMVIGTGGITQRDVNLADPELAYFAATAGVNRNLTYGAGSFDVTPDRLQVSFLRGAGGTFSDAFTLTRGTEPPTNEPPTASFTSTVTDLLAAFDATASTDVDGTVTAYSWSFGDGTVGSGRLLTHDYSQPGTYEVRLTVTDDQGATGTATRSVTVTQPPATQVVASDEFERTVSSGWGPAPVGGPWSVTSAGSVSAGEGRLTMVAPTSGPLALLNQVSVRDVEVQVEYSLDKVPTGSGARVDRTVFLRRTSAGDYRAMVRVLAGGAVRADFMRVVNGTTATLGSQVGVPGLTYAPGDVLLVKAQVSGTSPATLRLKVWKQGSVEPNAWTLERSDATAALQVAGAVGFQAYLSGAATNAPVQARYDDVVATRLP